MSDTIPRQGEVIKLEAHSSALSGVSNRLRLLLVVFSLLQSVPFILYLWHCCGWVAYDIITWELAITVAGLMVFIAIGSHIHTSSAGSTEALVALDLKEEMLRGTMKEKDGKEAGVTWEALVSDVASCETARRNYRKALGKARSLRTESIRILVLSFFAALFIAGGISAVPALIDAIKQAKGGGKGNGVDVSTTIYAQDEGGGDVPCPPCAPVLSCPPVNVDLAAVTQSLATIADKLDALKEDVPADTTGQGKVRYLEALLAKATADLSRQDALLAEWYLRTTDPNIFVRCRSRRELRKTITDMVGRQMDSMRQQGGLPAPTPRSPRTTKRTKN